MAVPSHLPCMPTVSPSAVADRLRADDEDLLLVDVRSGEAFADWHIPGSEHVDVYDELRNDPEDARAAFADLPADREIVTVCGRGEASATATDLLRDMGYEATTLAQGLRGWSGVHRAAPVSLEGPGSLLQVARPGTGCLSYVVVSGEEAVVVDPSQYVAEYDDLLADRDATLAAVVETHAHADHVSGAAGLADEHGVPHYLHPADRGALEGTTPLENGDELAVGDRTLRVVPTPGHTPGSVTLAVGEEALLTGDALFLDSVGRPDLAGGTEQDVRRRAETLYESLRALLEVAGDPQVAPAHHPGTPAPPRTLPVSAVREGNDLLGLSRPDFVDAIATAVPDPPPNHDRIKRVNTGRETVEEGVARGLDVGPNRCAAE